MTTTWPADRATWERGTGVDGVERLARRFAEEAELAPAVRDRAARLAERVATGRFHIAVLGDFKRGKSTLVNALIGRPVLPTGVVPLTTVATEVHFGSTAGAAVVFDDGRRLPVDGGALASYVSEEANPGNRLGVRRVEVGVPAGWAAPGLVLVDTPGLASVHEHQTASARQALADSDGAVVVLSVDSPLSASEEGLLTDLAARKATVFVAVNKCDHLAPPELAEVRRFLGDHLRRLLGGRADAFFVSARGALEPPAPVAEPAGPNGQDPGYGFAAFREALRAFVVDDLAAARAAAALAELQRIGDAVESSVAVEAAAAQLGLATLDTQLDRFRAAAAEGRRRFAEEQVVLEHEVGGLANELGRLLADGVTRLAAERWPEVAAAAEGVPGRRLDAVLDDAVAATVAGALEPLRREAQARAEAGWRALAGRLAASAQQRVEDLRDVAGALFEVHLPTAPVPEVRALPEHFSYLFLHVASPGTGLARQVEALVPLAAVRRHRLRRARRQLGDALDKHAGRARHDLVERLRETARRFVAEMAAELDETERSIVAAAERAGEALATGHRRQAARQAARERATALAREVADVVGRWGAGEPA